MNPYPRTLWCSLLRSPDYRPSRYLLATSPTTLCPTMALLALASHHTNIVFHPIPSRCPVTRTPCFYFRIEYGSRISTSTIHSLPPDLLTLLQSFVGLTAYDFSVIEALSDGGLPPYRLADYIESGRLVHPDWEKALTYVSDLNSPHHIGPFDPDLCNPRHPACRRHAHH